MGRGLAFGIWHCEKLDMGFYIRHACVYGRAVSTYDCIS
jgi:hypothetical protein